VFSLLRQLPAFAAAHRAAAPLLLSADACSTGPAAVDRHILPAGRSAANPPHAAAAEIDVTDGRTNGRLAIV